MKKKLPQIDLSYLPRCAGEYIKSVIKKMRYRKQVRADVLAELASDFEAELKECTGDEQKQQIARQLIDEFGDVKLLAALLRRAKKRCRPLWRKVIARSFQAVGVLILCFIFYVVWFLTGKPVITTNYVAELNKIVRPVPDESFNAEQLYNRAADLSKQLYSDDFLLFLAKNKNAIIDETFPLSIKGFSEKIDTIVTDSDQKDLKEDRQSIRDDISKIINELTKKKIDELNIEQKHFVKRLIQEREEALELIVEGSQRPYYWRTYISAGDNSPDEMISVLLPNLSEFKFLTRLLRLRANLRAEQGEYDNAFNDIKSCYRLGKHLRGDKFIIEQLVGIAIESLSVQVIRDMVGGYEIDSTILAEFQRNYEQIIADENFTICFKAERLLMYDEIQRCFTVDRLGRGHLYIPRFRKINEISSSYEGVWIEPFILDMVSSAQFLFSGPNKEETLNSVNELYDYCERLSLKTAAQIHADSEAIDDKLNKIFSDNILIGILTPAVKRILEIGNRHSTEVGSTLPIIAILRYNGDTGQYPQNLNQLVTAGYLKQLPIDSFTDKPLSYKKTEDNFILYSVGPNGTDEGGEYSRDSKGRIKNWQDNGDMVFWPVVNSKALK